MLPDAGDPHPPGTPPAQGERAAGAFAIGEELPALARADAWMGTGNARAKNGGEKEEPGGDLAMTTRGRNDTCCGPGKWHQHTNVCPVMLAHCTQDDWQTQLWLSSGTPCDGGLSPAHRLPSQLQVEPELHYRIPHPYCAGG